jgi:TRAP-type C4-dicarboxylate transport system permease small subunit
MAERPPPQQYDELGAPIPGAPRASESWFGAITMGLNIIGTFLIIAMAIAVNADVLGRDLFNHPVPGVYEFLGLSIVAVVFLQMANTLRENRHVANDIILQWVGQKYPRVSLFFYGVFYLVGATLMALIVWYVWPNFIDNYTNGFFRGTAGYVEIPIWPFMLPVIVGGAATAIQYVLLAIQEFAKLPRGAVR